MRYEIQPLGMWTGSTTKSRPHCPFKAPWSSTLELLDRETRHLGAKLVVIQLDVVDGHIRRDGMLHANAKVRFPGVKVSFNSRHGPMTYCTDRYPHWQHNVRAIARSLEALRLVDRYGVTGSGEQYRGFTAIEAAPADTSMTVEQAAEYIAAHAGSGYTAATVRSSREQLARAFRAAARALHPDSGGDQTQFARLSAARGLLEHHWRDAE